MSANGATHRRKALAPALGTRRTGKSTTKNKAHTIEAWTFAGPRLTASRKLNWIASFETCWTAARYKSGEKFAWTLAFLGQFDDSEQTISETAKALLHEHRQRSKIAALKNPVFAPAVARPTYRADSKDCDDDPQPNRRIPEAIRKKENQVRKKQASQREGKTPVLSPVPRGGVPWRRIAAGNPLAG